jgi:hypothetical protein
MFKKISLSSILLIGTASTVYANGNVPAAGPVMPVAPQSCGCGVESYIGASGGVGFLSGMRKESATFVDQHSIIPGNKNLHSNQASFDIYAGAQYNIPHSKFFVGLEPSVTFSNLKTKSTNYIRDLKETSKISSRYALGIDMKPGFKVTKNDAFFLTLGAEARSYKFNYTNNLGSNTSSRKNIWSFAYGAGYEHSFGKIAVGFRVKYRVANSSNLSAVDQAGVKIVSKIRPNVFTSMLTINYKI